MNDIVSNPLNILLQIQYVIENSEIEKIMSFDPTHKTIQTKKNGLKISMIQTIMGMFTLRDFFQMKASLYNLKLKYEKSHQYLNEGLVNILSIIQILF